MPSNAPFCDILICLDVTVKRDPYKNASSSPQGKVENEATEFSTNDALDSLKNLRNYFLNKQLCSLSEDYEKILNNMVEI